MQSPILARFVRGCLAVPFVVCIAPSIHAQKYGGEWTITPAINFTCGSGSVSLSISKIQIDDRSSTPTATLLPKFSGPKLTGRFSSSNSITASVVVGGYCQETYVLSLQFSDYGNCIGTLSAAYSGYCFGCKNASWKFSGRRSPTAAVSYYGTGFEGTSGIPAFTATAPVVGGNFYLTLSNSRGVATPGMILIGVQKRAVKTPFGGTQLLDPLIFLPVVVPVGGYKPTWPVPNNPKLFGVPLVLQAVEEDPGARRGLSFTHGMSLLLGS